MEWSLTLETVGLSKVLLILSAMLALDVHTSSKELGLRFLVSAPVSPQALSGAGGGTNYLTADLTPEYKPTDESPITTPKTQSSCPV